MVLYAADAKAPNRIHERPSERALSALWQRAHTLSEGLTTEDGRPLRVVYPGRANPRAGPDFRDAIIINEAGDPITGDVELHLKAPDWYSHRHHVDPNYNGVILHVVLWPKRESTSKQQSGIKTPVASVAHAMPLLRCAKDSTHNLVAHLRALDKRGLEEALDRAGDDRFLARSRGFAMEMAATDPDQVLYRAMMEALGYLSNRRPFRELAERVPIGSLCGSGTSLPLRDSWPWRPPSWEQWACSPISSLQSLKRLNRSRDCTSAFRGHGPCRRNTGSCSA